MAEPSLSTRWCGVYWSFQRAINMEERPHRGTIPPEFVLLPACSDLGDESTNQNTTWMWASEFKHNHQSIVIMEEDPVVIESATALFERHPSVSTLLMYHRGVLSILRGIPCHFTRNQHVILVGHGSKGSSGVAQLAKYGPYELASVVSTIKIGNSHLHTVSLFSCNLGNDSLFVVQLLQALKSFNVQTKLHLHKSVLSISSNGEIMVKSDGVWSYHDHSSTVIAELDRSGKVLTKAQLGCRGQVFPAYQGNALYFQTLQWPTHPQMFVPEELRKKYTSIDCLEGLTWSLFFEENEKRRAPDYIPEHPGQDLMAIWLIEPRTKAENIVFKHITNIRDLLVEIRYHAREEAAADFYYVLNDCIYKVQKTSLNVSLAGKFMNTNSQAEIENFLISFNDQKDVSSLQELRQGLKASKFNDFCRQTFQYQQCNYNCERWGHYFMVAVFSASVRNFRIFSLFLMSVIGCEVGRTRGTDSPLCTAFVGDDHPMVTDHSWLEPLRRGFYGCSVDNFQMARQDKQVWLDHVVAKENALYIKSKQMMNTVDHDQQTELDIFGRVKVMNKYVFSSYLEFFRGTPEGKKLKRGCSASPLGT
ncbi:uncharacterized protein LOC115367468 isoform X2 [Myripristis murdjan]|uniref:uncharacterized protein LOC115367468 isoform X2 n=1 Tax=Myripristis murdjan TaxID=586833 RepID=UPI0011762D82|nr:uncharacterized protein LOC115367468 isoform X2 [Myripristis murdjan]